MKLAKDKLKIKTKSKTLDFSGIKDIETFTREFIPDSLSDLPELLSAFVTEAAEDPNRGATTSKNQGAIAPPPKERVFHLFIWHSI